MKKKCFNCGEEIEESKAVLGIDDKVICSEDCLKEQEYLFKSRHNAH